MEPEAALKLSRDLKKRLKMYDMWSKRGTPEEVEDELAELGLDKPSMAHRDDPKPGGHKKPRPVDPKNHPGRFPEGDESIDLAAINLALGSDIDGKKPMSLDASHGGFPSFIFGPNRPKGSEAALAEGPFAQYAAELKQQENSAKAKAESSSSAQARGKTPAFDPNAYGRSSYDFSKQKNKGAARDDSDKPEPEPEPASTLSTDSSRSRSSSSSSRDSVISAIRVGPNVEHTIERDAEESVNRNRNSFAESSSSSSAVAPISTEPAVPAKPSLSRQSSTASSKKSPAAFTDLPPSTVERLRQIVGVEPGFAGRSGGAAMQRTPSSSSMASQSNGNGANGAPAPMTQMSAAMPVNAGQQMDINVLYQKVNELSEVLRDNREKTQGIIASAGELATRAASSGSSTDIKEADQQISAARIADLTRQVHNLTRSKEILLRENRENTKLIGEYETAVGQIVEMVRDLAYKKDMERHAAARDYNAQLQAEKDAHLETRLERDNWMNEAVKYGGMIREAYRLRMEEEEFPTYMVAALQNEVRGYRNALGMSPEPFERETGYQVLKHVENGAGEP